MTETPRRQHPYLPELVERLKQREIGRREFLGMATRLGLSTAAAYAMAGGVLGDRPVRRALAETPRFGGTLRVAMAVPEISDPALYDTSEKGNVARHIVEPLVRINRDGLAEPYLAESWEASDDLKTWTFRLRRGVKWSNGDDFGADDVIANVRRWLDPATGSSNRGRFSAMTATGGAADAAERLDEHTVRFHLQRPDLSLPESLADYPALIVHRRFVDEGGDLSRNPVGTGPFTLEHLSPGETAVLNQRSDVLWWGGDVYLDRITYLDPGDKPAAGVAALVADTVDATHQVDVDQVAALRPLLSLETYSTMTAHTGVARMKVTASPFGNIFLRAALQACIDHAKLNAFAYQGLGTPGEDHHVAPIHPEYFELPRRKQDYGAAKTLLAQAGYPDGIDLRIDCAANPAWELATCEAIAEMCRPAGFRITVNGMPGNAYSDQWLKTPLGFTSWAHRPLGVQVLNLAYRSGAAWNETSYANPAFDQLLDEAGSLLDLEDRRRVMAKLQAALQEDAIIIQPFWRPVFVAANKRVKGLYAQVALEHHYNKVWLA